MRGLVHNTMLERWHFSMFTVKVIAGGRVVVGNQISVAMLNAIINDGDDDVTLYMRDEGQNANCERQRQMEGKMG